MCVLFVIFLLCCCVLVHVVIVGSRCACALNGLLIYDTFFACSQQAAPRQQGWTLNTCNGLGIATTDSTPHGIWSHSNISYRWNGWCHVKKKKTKQSKNRTSRKKAIQWQRCVRWHIRFFFCVFRRFYRFRSGLMWYLCDSQFRFFCYVFGVFHSHHIDLFNSFVDSLIIRQLYKWQFACEIDYDVMIIAQRSRLLPRGFFINGTYIPIWGGNGWALWTYA